MILCERGIRTFETATRNTLDLNAVPVLKQLTHLPVIVDPVARHRHARPGAADRAAPAVAAGADGLHRRGPSRSRHAKSDGEQSLAFDEFGELMDELRRLQFVRSAESEVATVTALPSPGAWTTCASASTTPIPAWPICSRSGPPWRSRSSAAATRTSTGTMSNASATSSSMPPMPRTGPMTPVELTMVFDAVLRASRSVQRRHAQSIVLGDESDDEAGTA